jgi:hypothetical protein
MENIHEDIFPIENAELIHSAKKCAQILYFAEINTNFPNAKYNIRISTALKESVFFLETYKDFLMKTELNISQKERNFILHLLDYHIYSAKKILNSSLPPKKIREQIALFFPFTSEKESGRILFRILKKWCFSANYEIDSKELIREKLIWVNALSETLEKILYLQSSEICLYKEELLAIYRLLSLHTDNLATLLMSEEEKLKEIEIAKGFAKKVASSSAVVLSKDYKKKATEKIEETV